MSRLETPTATLLGLILVALSILTAAFVTPRERYQLTQGGYSGWFIRLDRFTGEAVVCRELRRELICGKEALEAAKQPTLEP